MKFFLGRGVLVGVTVLTALQGAPVLAERPSATPPGRPQAQVNVAERKAAAQGRLDQAKLTACKRQEAAINATLDRLERRSSNHIAVFDKISQRVQAFYADKKLNVSNYDALVADVTAKRSAATAAVAALESDFKCDGDNPKGVVAAFRGQLQPVRAALQAYRTSVKNLIVGIKSAVATERSQDQPDNSSQPANREGAER